MLFRSNETTRTINNDIIRIKTSKDPFRTYVEIQGQYVKQKDAEGKPDLKLHRLFMYAAATDGLIWPCPLIGDYHFEGILTNVDYLKAAEYYEKGFSILGPDQKIRLASLYINNLAGSSHTKEEGVEILKSCEDPKWEIITYKAHEGYEFYARKKKSPNS